MISINNLLNEIAGSPFPLDSPSERKEGKLNNYVDYNFKSDTEREYYVRFDSKWIGTDKEEDQRYNWATELTFFPVELRRDNDNTEVGGENFGRILATVIKALKDFVSEYKPEYVYWKGIVGKDESKPGSADSTKRQRIYNKIMDREASSIAGYDAAVGEKLSSIKYDGDIPIKDASPLFDYPMEPTIKDPEKVKQKLSRFNLSRS
jgi:hypothetical protein